MLDSEEVIPLSLFNGFPILSSHPNPRRQSASVPTSRSLQKCLGVENICNFPISTWEATATAIFLVWAYVPETWLHAIGIHYYPSRYWALALPTYMTVAVFLALIFYIGLNFLSTPPTSFNTLFDEFSREPSSFDSGSEEDEIPIEPISDIGINEINRLMFWELS